MHQMSRRCAWHLPPWALPFPHKQMVCDSEGASSSSLGQTCRWPEPYAAKHGSLSRQQLRVFAATGRTLSPFSWDFRHVAADKVTKVPAISGSERERSGCNYCQLLVKALSDSTIACDYSLFRVNLSKWSKERFKTCISFVFMSCQKGRKELNNV